MLKMEFNTGQIIHILIFLVCLLLAYILVSWGVSWVYRSLNGYSSGYFGGYSNSYSNNTKDELVEKIYNTLLEYVEEIGTSEYIEDYLMTIHDINAVNVAQSKAISAKYSKLYQIIDDICSKHKYKDKNEFIFFNGIKYMWFLPDDLRSLIVGKAKHKYQTFDKYAVKNNLEQLIYPTVAHRELINELVDKLMPLSRSYVKLKKSTIVKLGGVKSKKVAKKLIKKQAKKQSVYAKQSPEQSLKQLPKQSLKESTKELTKELTKDMLEPDIIGFNGVLNEIAEAVKATATSSVPALTPEEQLRKIDLMTLRWTDPEAVRSFITRIVPDIKRIIELDSTKYTNTVLQGLKTNLFRDITFEETELARERNRLREELEREKEHRLREQLELNSLKRDMNVEAQRKLEKEFEEKKRMKDFEQSAQFAQQMQHAMDLDKGLNAANVHGVNPFNIIELQPRAELSSNDDIFK